MDMRNGSRCVIKNRVLRSAEMVEKVRNSAEVLVNTIKKRNSIGCKIKRIPLAVFKRSVHTANTTEGHEFAFQSAVKRACQRATAHKKEPPEKYHYLPLHKVGLKDAEKCDQTVETLVTASQVSYDICTPLRQFNGIFCNIILLWVREDSQAAWP